MTYYCTPAAVRVPLDFIAEGDIGTLELDRLDLAIDPDQNIEKELQPTVPDSAHSVPPLVGK